MVSQKEFEKLADELIKKQGFIVIGFPPGVDGYEVGHETNRIMQFVMPIKYEVAATAKQADWNRQNDLVEKLRPEWRRFPNGVGGKFLKLKPLRPTLVAQPAEKAMAGQGPG